MRFVASVLLVVGVAAFTSACCCDPLGLIGLCVPRASVGPTTAPELHAVKQVAATTSPASTAPPVQRF